MTLARFEDDAGTLLDDEVTDYVAQQAGVDDDPLWDAYHADDIACARCNQRVWQALAVNGDDLGLPHMWLCRRCAAAIQQDRSVAHE